MILYSKHNIPIDSSNFQPFNHGRCATILKCNDIILKIYFLDCKALYRLNKSMFKCIKQLNDPNIVKLREYFYTFNSTLYRLSSIDAYTMNYVPTDSSRIIDLERQNIQEIFKSLDETLRKLSDKKIILMDVNTGNLIINQNRITIIDPDMFSRSAMLAKDYIYQLNKECLLDCINSIILKESKQEKISIYQPFFINDDHLTLSENIQKYLPETTIKEKLKRL